MNNCLYCPRCDKLIPKDELNARAEQLATMFDNRSLDEGRCPVCRTVMIDMDAVESGREARGE